MTSFQSKLISVANQNEPTKNLIDEKSAFLFDKLCSHMLEVNKSLNLTAIRDEDGVILKHIVDSSACVPYIPFGASVCDIGCGGGFPTLVIGVLRQDVSVLGVDSVTKKVNYVSQTSSLLGLENVIVSNARAEEMGQSKELRESFDIVTARAVGRLNLICELCLPLIKTGGRFLAMKSITTGEELEEAKNAIEILGGEVENVKEYSLTDGKETVERTIIVIKKVKNTPKLYPRNNSQIAKKPL
ncbi:MAG: 16S rRNA (guanine(527)-N(7))-methyltransferase RsmG [Clostridia bacterium]|nr:16S rRNA (guanine(527)-N(7))-methyltransferase RsmG [Clostridia bacterium]